VRDILTDGDTVFMPSPALGFFLKNHPSAKKGLSPRVIDQYLRIDDNDVLLCIKCWQDAKDPILADLSTRFLNRRFFRTTFTKKHATDNEQAILIEQTRKALKEAHMPHDEHAASYYLFFDKLVNEAYRYESEGIWILQDNATAIEFSRASETGNISALTKAVVKPYVVHIKDIRVT
jgi:hypothetical protein